MTYETLLNIFCACEHVHLGFESAIPDHQLVRTNPWTFIDMCAI